MGRARPNEFHPAMASGPLGGRIALVTGSTSGIGLGIARVLAAAGADIVLNGFGEAAKIEKAQAGIAADHGVRAAFVGADLGKADGCTRLIVEAERVLGRIDILVNNAGIQHTAPVEAFPPERWDAIIALNLTAAFHTMRAAIPGMKARGWGRIVNIASAHGLVASAQKSAYVAAKHGLVGLTKVAAIELANAGVSVNAVCPGWVLTPLVERQIADRARAKGVETGAEEALLLAEKQPMLKFSTPEHIGAMVRFLCTDDAATITGTALPVDGGWTAQ